MKPPEGFLRDLRALDPKLSARWTPVDVKPRQPEDTPGKYERRWQIWYEDQHGREFLVLTVMEPPEPGEKYGAYRPLDQRVIGLLKRVDAYNRGSREIVREIEKAEEAAQAAARQGYRDFTFNFNNYYRRALLGNPLIHTGWRARV